MDQKGLRALPRCSCRFCSRGDFRTCAKTRIASHLAEVSKIIESGPTVTLVVGSDKARLSCHKMLLCFYSEFFNKTLYGPFKEAQETEIALPDDDIEDMTLFVEWLSTGILNTDDTHLLFSAWILGDRIGAPEFTNDAMSNLSNNYRKHLLNAEEAQCVYVNTIPGSKLRNFIVDLIDAEGPFSAAPTAGWEKRSREDYHAAWISLLEEGGDIIVENVKTGFRRHSVQKSSWQTWNMWKYFVEEPRRDPDSAEAWHRDKTQVELERRKDFEKSQPVERGKNLKRSWDAVSSTDPASLDKSHHSLQSRQPGLRRYNACGH